MTPQPTALKDLPEILTIQQVAAFFQVSPDNIRDRIRAGQIPAVRLGNRDRIFRQTLEAMRDQLTPTTA